MHEKYMDGSSIYNDPVFKNPLLLSGDLIPSLPDIWDVFPEKLTAALPYKFQKRQQQQEVQPEMQDDLPNWRKVLSKDWVKERWERFYETLTPQEWQLQEAARKNQVIQLYRLVQEKGVSVDVASEQGQTPLMIALANQHYSAAMALLKLGSRVDVSDNKGLSPILLLGLSPIAFDRPQHEALISQILETCREKSLEMDEIFSQTTAHLETIVLLLAKASYDVSLKSILCAASPALRLSLVQRPDEDGMTPLMYAAWNNHADLAEFLILTLPTDKREPYIRQRNRWGRSAMDIAGHWREKSALSILHYHNNG
ncbi:MAG: ankyrin repeat domain-containing protein [Vampirovibrionales bacterium]|nr:ankyrin repeat domain-containing protein [Vampirovibrionales bacterium]